MPPAPRAVYPHLTNEELKEKFRTCEDPEEKMRWQAVLLSSEGWSRKDVAAICKRPPDFARRWIIRYNEQGPAGLIDGRVNNGNEPYLSEAQLLELSEELSKQTEDCGLWTGPLVAQWMEKKLGHPVHPTTGTNYLHKLNMTLQVPRPALEKADKEEQEVFKKKRLKRRPVRSPKRTRTPR